MGKTSDNARSMFWFYEGEFQVIFDPKKAKLNNKTLKSKSPDKIQIDYGVKHGMVHSIVDVSILIIVQPSGLHW